MNKSKAIGPTPEEYKQARRDAMIAIRPYILLMVCAVIGCACFVVVVLSL